MAAAFGFWTVSLRCDPATLRPAATMAMVGWIAKKSKHAINCVCGSFDGFSKIVDRCGVQNTKKNGNKKKMSTLSEVHCKGIYCT